MPNVSATWCVLIRFWPGESIWWFGSVFTERWFPTEGVCLAGECCPLALCRNARFIAVRFAGDNLWLPKFLPTRWFCSSQLVFDFHSVIRSSWNVVLPSDGVLWLAEWEGSTLGPQVSVSLGSCLDFQLGQLKVKRDRIFIYAGKMGLGTSLFQAISQIEWDFIGFVSKRLSIWVLLFVTAVFQLQFDIELKSNIISSLSPCQDVRVLTLEKMIREAHECHHFGKHRPPLHEWLVKNQSESDRMRLKAVGNIVIPRCARLAAHIMAHAHGRDIFQWCLSWCNFHTG